MLYFAHVVVVVEWVALFLIVYVGKLMLAFLCFLSALTEVFFLWPQGICVCTYIAMLAVVTNGRVRMKRLHGVVVCGSWGADCEGRGRWV